MTWLPWMVAAWLLGMGLYGVVTSRNYVHLIGCLSVVQSSTYVILLGAGFGPGGAGAGADGCGDWRHGDGAATGNGAAGA